MKEQLKIHKNGQWRLVGGVEEAPNADGNRNKRYPPGSQQTEKLPPDSDPQKNHSDQEPHERVYKVPPTI